MKYFVALTLAVLAFGSCWDECCYSCCILTGLMAAIRLAVWLADSFQGGCVLLGCVAVLNLAGVCKAD